MKPEDLERLISTGMPFGKHRLHCEDEMARPLSTWLLHRLIAQPCLPGSQPAPPTARSATCAGSGSSAVAMVSFQRLR